MRLYLKEKFIGESTMFTLHICIARYKLIMTYIDAYGLRKRALSLSKSVHP